MFEGKMGQFDKIKTRGSHMNKAISNVAVVGCGVIGSGWAARCLAHGLNVIATDPAPHAEKQMRENIAIAWDALKRAGLPPGASLERLRFTPNLQDAVAGANFIQESASENEQLKRKLLAEIERHCPPDTIVASSTSAFMPTTLQSSMTRPERLLVGHPFNPVYLLPLLELVGGERTSEAALTTADSFYRSVGMRPLRLRKEVFGFLANRLQEAMWREVLWMVSEGVASTEELDASVTYGCGLRWSLMGTCLTFHLAGGQGGMRHMLEHFGPSFELPMTKLKAPELTPELIERMVEGCEQQAAGRSVSELNARRDRFLVDLLALVRQYWPEAEGLAGRI
jgi:carnitine 3-dehydrogenase